MAESNFASNSAPHDDHTQSDLASNPLQDASLRLEQVKSDPRFAQFFADSFDVSQYIRDLLASSSMQAQASRNDTVQVPSGSQDDRLRLESGTGVEVSKAVTELGEVIREQIISYKKPLLRQALHVLQLDQWVSHIRKNVQDFNGHFSQVRSELREPFDALSQQSAQVSKAHKLSRMLRSVHLFTVQLGRLKRFLTPDPTSLPPSAASQDSHSAPTTASSINLSETASLIHELLTLVETERLAGITVIDREIPWINALKSLFQTRANEWFDKLIPKTGSKPTPANVPSSSLNLIDESIKSLVVIPTLTDAVRVLYALRTLDVALKTVLEKKRAATSHQIAAALEVSNVKMSTVKPSTKGGSQEPHTLTTTSLAEQRRLALWTQLDALFHNILPSHLEFLLNIHRSLVSLWRHTMQSSPDAGVDSAKIRAPESLDPSTSSLSYLDDQSPASSESSSLASFLRFLLPQSGNAPPELDALITANDPGSIAKHLWSDIIETEMCDVMLKVSKRNKQVEQILSADFPRLLRLFHDLSEHVTNQLERNGFSFTHLMRTHSMYHATKEREENDASQRSKPTDPSASPSSAPRLENGASPAMKSYSLVKPSTSTIRALPEDRTLLSPLDSSVILQSAIQSSKMELLVGNDLWGRMSTRLQTIELEYQKVLVSQFFTPINGMFAGGTISTPASLSSTQDPSQQEKWQIFGPLGSGSRSQKGGIVVGGRMLLPGEVILAISSKGEVVGSGSSGVGGGRWVGGSPYLCKWLSIVKHHFDSLQSASPTLVRTLLPKFLMALNKSIKLLVLKTEEVISHEEEASQVNEMPPPSQRFNAAVYNALASVYSFLHQYIYSAIQAQFNIESSELHVAELASSLQSICTLNSHHLVGPIFTRARNLIHKCLYVDFHQTDWSNTSAASSLYLRTLMRLLSHLSTYIFSLFTNSIFLPSSTDANQNQSILSHHAHALAKTLASGFVLSSSLIRHISDTAKMRLIGDLTQLEQACQSLEQTFGENGNSAPTDPQATSSPSDSDKPTIVSPSSSILRGFKEVLFADLPAITEASHIISSAAMEKLGVSQEADSSVTPQMTSLAEAMQAINQAALWHLVLLRAPAPEALSPHSIKNWSVRQYCEWLGKTPLTQIWALFQTCLAEAKKGPSPLPQASLDIFKALESLAPTMISLQSNL